MKDMKQCIAYIFRRREKEKMGEREILNSMSLDLRWFSPVDAKKCLKNAVEMGFLKKDGEYYYPTFNIDAVEIPMDFKPSEKVLDKMHISKRKDIFAEIINEICIKKDVERRKVIANINRKKADLNLDVEVVALIVAKEMGIDPSKFFDDVENIILYRMREEK